VKVTKLFAIKDSRYDRNVTFLKNSRGVGSAPAEYIRGVEDDEEEKRIE
jgi:hypothetical protein